VSVYLPPLGGVDPLQGLSSILILGGCKTVLARLLCALHGASGLLVPDHNRDHQIDERAASAHSHEERLAPLVGLVDRLREELTELQWRGEALGEELEAKRLRLRLAEATVELLQRPRGEEAAPSLEARVEGGGVLDAGEEEYASQAPQASVAYAYPMSPEGQGP
jgi:hypothetical protein